MWGWDTVGTFDFKCSIGTYSFDGMENRLDHTAHIEIPDFIYSPIRESHFGKHICLNCVYDICKILNICTECTVEKDKDALD